MILDTLGAVDGGGPHGSAQTSGRGGSRRGGEPVIRNPHLDASRLRQITAATAALLASSLGMWGCAPVPVYDPPSDLSRSAHIRLSQADWALFKVVALYHYDGERVCGQPEPGKRKVIVISRGNPLITDLNVEGAHIPADGKFSYVVMGMWGLSQCWIENSLVPAAGAHYELKLSHDRFEETCTLDLVEFVKNTKGTEDARSTKVKHEPCPK